MEMALSVKDILASPLRNKKSLRAVLLLLVVLPFTSVLFYWCHQTNSLALRSFAYLTLFNVGSLLTYLLSVWVSKQQPTPKFSYGFERVNVLAVFSTSILLILFCMDLIKHSVGRIFEPPKVLTDNMLIGMCTGLIVHFIATCGVTNPPLIHTTEAAPSNWFQRALHDLCHSVFTFSPYFRHLRTSKVDPITLLAFGGALTVLLVQLMIDIDELYLADVAGCLFISALICGTMMPLAIYSATILLQTAPEHVLPLLDKSLREVSTLDGVLEIKNEHFWTITYGSYAGSLHVRVRRDANEQEVLTQLTSRLASQLNDLTIQIVKEDLTLPSVPLNKTTSRQLSQTLPSSTFMPREQSVPLTGGEKPAVPLQSIPQFGQTGHQALHKHSLGTFPSL